MFYNNKNTAKRNMSSAVWASSMCKMFLVKLLSKVVFRQRSFSVKDRLPSKVSSVKDRLPSKVVFRQRSSSVKGRLPSKVVFRQRLSSVKGRLPSKVLSSTLTVTAQLSR